MTDAAMSDPVLALGQSPLLAGCSTMELSGLLAQMSVKPFEAGELLMREGEAGEHFALLVSGEVEVTALASGAAVTRHLATAGPGSVLGELAMLLDHPRHATVTAITPVTALIGGTDAFGHLLALPEVYERMAHVVSTRLAEDVVPVRTTLPDGSPVLLRPLVPSDREIYTAAVRDLSRESLRLRFFTGGQPSDLTIEYLLDISYTDHFAWTVVDPSRPAAGVAVGRYIRSKGASRLADLAFGVSDDYQGRGIGTLLLGALAAAAPAAGIEVFTADVLAENTAMRRVLHKAGARFKFEEPGVVHTAFPVSAATGLIYEELRDALEVAAHDIVTAGGLALAQPPP